MSATSETITTFLPYLRRYARALTGSQEEGDRCVRLCLEELLSDPHRLGDQRFDGRMALFGEFHRVWRRMNDEASREATRSAQGGRIQIRRCVAGLPARGRQAEGRGRGRERAVRDEESPEVEVYIE